MQPSCCPPGWRVAHASGGGCATSGEAVRGLLSGARGATLATLFAVTLDLPRELVLADVDCVVHLGGGRVRAQRDALQIERRLGDLSLGDRRVALLAQLDLELSQLGHLTRDRSEASLDVLSESVADWGVPSLDRDAHSAPPLRRVGWIFPRS